MKAATWFWIGTSLWAQSVQILPSPPTGSQAGSFRVMLVSPAKSAVAAVQWRISLPKGVSVEPGKIQPGTAAQRTGKTVHCAAPGIKTNTSSDVVCVLAGGKQPIPNGAVAVVPFVAANGISAISIRLRQILGATPEGKATAFADVEETISLNQP